jgi:hypothetical protein
MAFVGVSEIGFRVGVYWKACKIESMSLLALSKNLSAMEDNLMKLP